MAESAGFDTEFFSQNDTNIVKVKSPYFFREGKVITYAMCCEGEGIQLRWWNNGKSKRTLQVFVSSLPEKLVGWNVQVDYFALRGACDEYNVEFPSHIYWFDGMDIVGGIGFSAWYVSSLGTNASWTPVRMSLDNVAKILNFGGKDEKGKELVISGRAPDEFSPEEKRTILKYCALDARLALKITQHFLPYYRTHPSRPDGVLSNFVVSDKINRRGVLVDKKFVERLKVIGSNIDEQLCLKIQTLTGQELDGEIQNPYVTSLSQREAFKRFVNFAWLCSSMPEAEGFWFMNQCDTWEDEKILLTRCGLDPQSMIGSMGAYVSERQKFRSDMYYKNDVTRLKKSTHPLHEGKHLKLILDALRSRVETFGVKCYLDTTDKETLRTRKYLLPRDHPKFKLGQELLRWHGLTQQAAFTKSSAIGNFYDKNGRVLFGYTPMGTISSRFASRGLNLQNFAKSTIDQSLVKKILAGKITMEDPDTLRKISQMARRIFVAPKGHTLMVFDLKSVEMRSTYMGFVYQEGMSEVIAEGRDIYDFSSENFFKDALSSVHDAKDRRLISKVLMLASQYGMGASKMGLHLFSMTGRSFGKDEVMKLVLAWRKGNAQLVNYRDEMMDNLAKVGRGGSIRHPHYQMEMMPKNQGIRFTMPSGRCLYYWGFAVKVVDDRRSLSFLASMAGGRVSREILHAGSLYAHFNSGVCTDIFVDIIRIIQIKYPWIHIDMMTHDDIVVCVPNERMDEAKENILGVANTYRPQWMPSVFPEKNIFPMDCQCLEGFNER